MARRAVRLALLLVLLGCGFLPSAALACTVCTNPNLRAPDAPADQRTLRLRLGLKVGAASAGGVELDDRRIDMLYTVDLVPRLELSVDVPALARTTRVGARARVDVVPGDLELAATGTLWAFKADATLGGVVQAERLALRGGLKLPTAPILSDPVGRPLPSVLQPGCSAIVPSFAVSYAVAAARWSVATELSLVLPIAVRDGPHTATSLRSSVTFTLRANDRFSALVGLGTRLDQSGELAEGVADPSSGGFVGSTIVGARASILPALALDVAMYTPVVQALAGDQRLSTTWAAAIEAQF